MPAAPDPPPVRTPSALLRIAELAEARALSLESALALAASMGFERIEAPAGLFLDGEPRSERLAGLLRELGLRLSSVTLPRDAASTDVATTAAAEPAAQGRDPVACLQRVEPLGCHRLTVALDADVPPSSAGHLGRQLDALGYRLAGRSARLTVRSQARDPELRRQVLGTLLREVSQSAVGLELELAEIELRTQWRDRVHGIAAGDHEWIDGGTAARSALDWLGRHPTVEAVVRGGRAGGDDDPLARFGRHWREAVEAPPDALRPAPAGSFQAPRPQHLDRLPNPRVTAAPPAGRAMYSRI